MMKKKGVNKSGLNNRGQVTMFIIIGIVIVVFAVLIFLFWPKISSIVGSEKSPEEFIQDCLGGDLKETVDLVSSQGGSINPKNYFLYKDDKLELLCYTSEDYKLCTMQQPLLKQHIENEIKSEINDKVKTCFDKLQSDYQGKGYEVSLQRKNFSVELLPNKVSVVFNYPLTLTKGDVKKYEQIRISLNNNLYELVGISNSILNTEATYGDSETTIYMTYYPWLKVEKLKQTYGETVYILTDRDSGNKFQFATRSMPWPPGYGAGY